MKSIFLFLSFFLWMVPKPCRAQGRIDSFRVYGDVKVTIDAPSADRHKKTMIIFFALPNGNSTEQTMGKKMQPGDDWHYDIQHIRAQTAFLRQTMRSKNIVVIYLENNYKSWPSWKQKHTDYRILLPHLVDSLIGTVPGRHKTVCLNGHSGGGSLIFGYLSGLDTIPSRIRRICFLDSDYGYDSTYYPRIRQWLQHNKKASLMVFAYNDSIALYNGKPLVSATGGTWYRSHLLLSHLARDFQFTSNRTDSLEHFSAAGGRIQFFFKYNLNRGIYHTQQVELNGFIHSILAGTRYDSRRYQYYGTRVYNDLIQ